MRFLYIAAGGAIGALLRYGIAGLPPRYFSTVFPLGTLTVNFIGCFIIGLLWGTFERVTIAPDARTFLIIGILGAFTTFSSYSLESFNLIREGELRLGLTNILVSNIGCITLCFLGFIASKQLVSLLK